MNRTHPPTYPPLRPHPEEPAEWKEIAIRLVVLLTGFALAFSVLVVMV